MRTKKTRWQLVFYTFWVIFGDLWLCRRHDFENLGGTFYCLCLLIWTGSVWWRVSEQLAQLWKIMFAQTAKTCRCLFSYIFSTFCNIPTLVATGAQTCKCLLLCVFPKHHLSVSVDFLNMGWSVNIGFQRFQKHNEPGWRTGWVGWGRGGWGAGGKALAILSPMRRLKTAQHLCCKDCSTWGFAYAAQ